MEATKPFQMYILADSIHLSMGLWFGTDLDDLYWYWVGLWTDALEGLEIETGKGGLRTNEVAHD